MRKRERGGRNIWVYCIWRKTEEEEEKRIEIYSLSKEEGGGGVEPGR